MRHYQTMDNFKERAAQSARSRTQLRTDGKRVDEEVAFGDLAVDLFWPEITAEQPPERREVLIIELFRTAQQYGLMSEARKLREAGDHTGRPRLPVRNQGGAIDQIRGAIVQDEALKKQYHDTFHNVFRLRTALGISSLSYYVYSSLERTLYQEYKRLAGFTGHIDEPSDANGPQWTGSSSAPVGLGPGLPAPAPFATSTPGSQASRTSSVVYGACVEADITTDDETVIVPAVLAETLMRPEQPTVTRPPTQPPPGFQITVPATSGPRQVFLPQDLPPVIVSDRYNKMKKDPSTTMATTRTQSTLWSSTIVTPAGAEQYTAQERDQARKEAARSRDRPAATATGEGARPKERWSQDERHSRSQSRHRRERSRE